MKALIFMLCVSLALPGQVLAQEPEPEVTTESTDLNIDLNLRLPEFSYSILREGQTLTANRDTYLLTPESFARITTEYQFMQRRYQLHFDEQLRLSRLESQLRIDIMTNQNSFLETELERTNRLMIELQEAKGRDLTPLWVAVSFVAGCALTVGLVYALQPGIQGN